jgi:hypothetical protein
MKKSNSHSHFCFIVFSVIAFFVIYIFLNINYAQSKKQRRLNDEKQNQSQQKKQDQDKKDFQTKWFKDLIDLGNGYPQLGRYTITWEENNYKELDVFDDAISNGKLTMYDANQHLDLINRQYDFEKIKWNRFNSDSVVSYLNNARIFSTIDVDILTRYFRERWSFPQIEYLGRYFSSYTQARDEFEKHTIEEPLKSFLNTRLKQLLNIPYFVIPRSIVHLSQYSFSKHGFEYDARDLGSNYTHSEISFNQSKTPRHESILKVTIGYLYENKLPSVIPMNEDVAQDFLRECPERIIKAYILCKPVQANPGGGLVLKISYLIFTTLDDNVFYIFSLRNVSKLNNLSESVTPLPIK